MSEIPSVAPSAATANPSLPQLLQQLNNLTDTIRYELREADVSRFNGYIPSDRLKESDQVFVSLRHAAALLEVLINSYAYD